MQNLLNAEQPSSSYLRRYAEAVLVLIAMMTFFIAVFSIIDIRPMHHDEANQAYSARRLLDFHGYAFKPEDHHGPTLYFALLPVAWLRGVFRGCDLDIATVRLVPLLFTCILMTLPFMMRFALGRGSCFMTTLVICLSPCFVFYSHYFVQEMMLVVFLTLTLFAAWRWWFTRTRTCAIATGIGFGLCVATKETWVISAAAVVVAIFVLAILHRRDAKANLTQLPWKEIGLAFLTACVVDAIFFSSFFSNPRGILDFFACWIHYFKRGTSGDTAFAAPPYRYLQWMFWFKTGNGPRWSEWLILAGFVLGVLQLFIKRLRPEGLKTNVLTFFIVYSLAQTTFYSLISYKTPWCSLTILHGYVIVAGIGYAGLVWSPMRECSIACALLFGAAAFSMINQCQLTVGRYATDPKNPYAYAHTQRDYLRMVKRIQTLMDNRKHPVHTLVMTNYVNAWPLPWYFQDNDWFTYVDFNGWETAPETDDRLKKKLATEPEFIVCELEDIATLPQHQRYSWEDVTLRPNVIVRFGTRKDCYSDSIQH